VEQGLATVRLVCSGWKCRHDALLMRLVLRQDATNEGVLVRRGGALNWVQAYCHLRQQIQGHHVRCVRHERDVAYVRQHQKEESLTTSFHD
jgi:hypothetical protein